MEEKFEKISKRFHSWELKYLNDGSGYAMKVENKIFVERCPERVVDKVIAYFKI